MGSARREIKSSSCADEAARATNRMWDWFSTQARAHTRSRGLAAYHGNVRACCLRSLDSTDSLCSLSQSWRIFLVISIITLKHLLLFLGKGVICIDEDNFSLRTGRYLVLYGHKDKREKNSVETHLTLHFAIHCFRH